MSRLCITRLRPGHPVGLMWDISEYFKSVFPGLDNFKDKDKCWVIDIGGNSLRLIAFIEFRDNRMYVRHITSHTEYDKLRKKYVKESKR